MAESSAAGAAAVIEITLMLDAAKMTLDLAQDAEPDEDRNQVLGAISRYLERRT